MNILHLET